jgi:heme/copper-type cytochrome/quinol oxidase subunit 2
MKLKYFANLLLNAASILAVAAARTFACPMCKANIANAENANEIAATINTAILILLAPTFALIGGLVRLVFKYRHYHNDEQYGPCEQAVTPLAHTGGAVPVIKYVNLTTSGSERDAQQRQRDPAHRGTPLHSSEEHQSPPGFHD